MSINFMQKIKANWQKLIFITSVLLVPMVSFAQGNVPAPADQSGKLVNPINANDFGSFIKTLLGGLIKIGIPVIAVAIIYSGFLFVAARGNSEKLSKAKDTLLYTLIGAAILLGSLAIAQLIQATVTSLY